MSAHTIVIRPSADGSVSIEIPHQAQALTKDNEPLVISSYLADKGMPVDKVRRKVAAFGKTLKVLYRLEHGQEPPTTERWIGGQLRAVAAYTAADRRLFDQVWQLMPR